MFGLVALNIAANIIIDPLAIFGLWNIPGFNAEKVWLGRTGSRVEKSLHLWLSDYDVVFLGTSRVEVGLDPRSAALAGRRAYNAGLAGTNVVEIEKVGRFLLAIRPPAMIVLGLDFLAFTDRRGVEADFAQSGFSGRPLPLVLLSTLVGAATTAGSVATIADNLGGEHARVREDGFLRAVGGYGAGWDGGSEFPRRLRKMFLLNPETYACYRYDPDRVRLLRDFVVDARKAGIDVRLFLSPMHVWQLEALRALGLMPIFQRWRSDMAGIVAAVNGATPEIAPLVLWDFGGYNSITTEDVPAPREGTIIRNYWDASHYTMAVGDRVLERLLNPGASAIMASDFGNPLVTGTVDETNAALASGHASFKALRPDEVAIVDALVAETAERRGRLCRALTAGVSTD